MSVTVKIEGLRELEQNLNRLSKTTGRAVLRRTLKTAAEPLAELARGLAPDDPNTDHDDLVESITVSTKLSKTARRRHRKLKGNDAAEMFVGTNDVAGSKQEFGTVNHPPQPFLRPAWEQDQDALLGRIKDELGKEIDKAVARAARKAARG